MADNRRAMSATDFIEAFQGQDWAQKPDSLDSNIMRDYFLESGGMIDRVKLCQKFSFGDLLTTFDINEGNSNVDPLRDTAIQFYTNGINICPFQHCWFEWSIKYKGHNMQIVCIIENADDCMYFQPFFLNKSSDVYGCETWTFSGWVTRLKPNGDLSRFSCVRGDQFDNPSDESMGMDVFAVSMSLASMAILMARETKVTERRLPAGVNAHRFKKGRAPLFAHKVVTIDHSRIVYEGGSGQSGIHRSSPRLHWRRGHVRTLSSGKKIGIPPCVVGAAENGVIDKTYRIRAPDPAPDTPPPP